MKKDKIFSIVVLMAVSINGISQVFNGSADGKNTIVVDGASVGFDISQTALSFTYNNYFAKAEKPTRFLSGVNLSGKSAGGVANLFASGHIVPETNFTGLIGFSHSSMKGLPVRSLEYQQLVQKEMELAVQYRARLKLIIDSVKTAEVKLVFTNNNFRDSLLVVALNKMSRDSTVKKEIRDDAALSLARLLVIYNNYFLPATATQLRIQSLNEQRVKDKYWRFVMYADAGLNSSNFKFLNSLDTTDFAKSISKEKFRGGFAGAGINWQYRGWLIIGLKYTYLETNNASSLTLTEYKLETEHTNASQTFTTETVISAYGAGYKRYAQNQFAADFMLVKPVNDSLNFIFDVYGKYNQRSNDTIRSLNIGVSWFMFKPGGKFIGGLYIELPDALGQLEEDLPIEDQRESINRVSFGVVGRFSLSTMGEYFYGK